MVSNCAPASECRVRQEATAWAQRYNDDALERNVLAFLGQAFDLNGV